MKTHPIMRFSIRDWSFCRSVNARESSSQQLLCEIYHRFYHYRLISGRAHPAHRLPLLPRAREPRELKKRLNVRLKNASLGQIWAVGKDLNIPDNRNLIA